MRLSLISGMLFASLAVSAVAQENPKLVCARVTQPPTLNGNAADAVWQQAKTLDLSTRRVLPPNEGATTRVTIRSVHTDTDIFFLVMWEDAAADMSHKSWIWNGEKNAYEEGKDREDMFALAFEHTGPFTADMLSGDEAVWDVWHWKAFRTNPQGYAMDKTHRYTREKPAGKANQHKAKNDKMIWIARPEDAGDSVEKKQPAPARHTDDSVPQYVPGTPTGSAADVRAKGAWSGGRWTLELQRKLHTGNPDDTAFDLQRTYQMAVATHDKTGDMDKASSVIELSFEATK